MQLAVANIELLNRFNRSQYIQSRNLQGAMQRRINPKTGNKPLKCGANVTYPLEQLVVAAKFFSGQFSDRMCSGRSASAISIIISKLNVQWVSGLYRVCLCLSSASSRVDAADYEPVALQPQWTGGLWRWAPPRCFSNRFLSNCLFAYQLGFFIHQLQKLLSSGE